MDINEALHRIFGFGSFRPNQRELVEAILGGRDCFAVMPTGGGKSLCYQLPAHLLPGTCLVISPLIALMKDQVDAARETGLKAACCNSSQNEGERREALRGLAEGSLDMLYVSPERFALESFQRTLARSPVSFVAVDEAHCVSEWGHDFRPDYLLLESLTTLLRAAPLAAFTATATARVQQDIVARLRLRNPFVVRASFNRPNLFYEVVPRSNPRRQIARIVQANRGQSGIVYRMTRKSVESTADMLTRQGVKALPYHAGLDDAVRARNQEAFDRDEVDVVVATIAFGMGIDKPNVRYVVHGDLPKNIESYYQETGRAGRDGEPARCTLLFSGGDVPRIRHFVDQVEDEAERERLLRALRTMATYAVSESACRRKQLLAYFGEPYGDENCGACDVCTATGERVDATVDAQKLLSAIARTGSRFGASHIAAIVCGAQTARIRELGHDRLPTYGVGKDRDRQYWRTLTSDLLTTGVVVQSEGQFPVLGLGEGAAEVLRGTRKFLVRRTAQPAARVKESLPTGGLFDRLREVRSTLARTRRVPAYMVFSDRTLRDMAEKRPRTPAELLYVHGVGEAKMDAYGAAFIAVLNAHQQESGSSVVPQTQ